MLSGNEILRQRKLGNIVIEPFDEKCINANSYFLHLSDELVVYDADVLESKKPTPTKTFKIPKEGFVLQPGELYLGRTIEYTETFKHVPLLNGRLSIASLGICIHITAGFGDNGFKGTWTLEISCIKPVRIYAGMKICHICYFALIGDDSIKYTGKYLGQRDVTASRIFKDFNDENEVK